MILKEKSIYGSLYKWFYATERLPKSLCDFFWKFLFAVILCIPVFILRIPYIITHRKTKLSETYDPVIPIGIVSYMILGIFSVVIYGWIDIIIHGLNLKLDLHNKTLMITFMTLMVLFVFGLIVFIMYLKNKKPTKIKVIQITKEYIKGVKNNYCPRINWI